MSGFMDFLGSQQGQSAAGGLGGIVDSFMPQNNVNEEFLERNKDIAAGMGRMDSITDTISSAALSSGNPWAMAGGLVLKGASALGKSSQDQFGVIKDSGKAIAAGILNPIQGVATLLGQKKRREARDRFIGQNMGTAITENTQTGNTISNSIPQYQPPGYGKQGMKLKTKFSYHGKSKF